MTSTALLTDRYELTMVDAALQAGTHDTPCVFELFARRLPHGRRYGVVAGTGRLIESIAEFRFGAEELAFLKRESIVSPETLDVLQKDQLAEGEMIVAEAVEALGLTGATTQVLSGHAGQVICNLAAELDASSIVIGSRGRGGIKRAVLGSVSDHVVRHAPCPVVVVGPGAED